MTIVIVIVLIPIIIVTVIVIIHTLGDRSNFLFHKKTSIVPRLVVHESWALPTTQPQSLRRWVLHNSFLFKKERKKIGGLEGFLVFCVSLFLVRALQKNDFWFICKGEKND